MCGAVCIHSVSVPLEPTAHPLANASSASRTRRSLQAALTPRCGHVQNARGLWRQNAANKTNGISHGVLALGSVVSIRNRQGCRGNSNSKDDRDAQRRPGAVSLPWHSQRQFVQKSKLRRTLAQVALKGRARRCSAGSLRDAPVWHLQQQQSTAKLSTSPVLFESAVSAHRPLGLLPRQRHETATACSRSVSVLTSCRAPAWLYVHASTPSDVCVYVAVCPATACQGHHRRLFAAEAVHPNTM